MTGSAIGKKQISLVDFGSPIYSSPLVFFFLCFMYCRWPGYHGVNSVDGIVTLDGHEGYDVGIAIGPAGCASSVSQPAVMWK